MNTDAWRKFWGLVGALLLGSAAYWFIGGSNVTASDTRTWAVIGQIAVGVALLLWVFFAARKQGRKSSDGASAS